MISFITQLKKIYKICFILFISLYPLGFCAQQINSTHSVARQWNEVLLNAIRNDFARPTVHARNLFHASIIAYDAWALFECQAKTIFLGQDFGDFNVEFSGISSPYNKESARHEIISYAMYRFLNHRFRNSPGAEQTLMEIETLFESYGYQKDFTSIDYSSGSYAALGNYLAQEIISFGLQDGANELNEYRNQYYRPVNPPLVLDEYVDTLDIDPNRWQPLSFDLFVDQSGNSVPVAIPPFLGPEWGSVTPFSLTSSDSRIIDDPNQSIVYIDPGPPEYLNQSNGGDIDDPYKWHFSLVASWSSFLDPNDTTRIDISPKEIGNLNKDDYPKSFDAYTDFYDFNNGGDIGKGHPVNPKTGMPYETQLVKRADYARVLAEFWADGPDSETPPGHWFTILNYVNDQPELIKKFGGEGPIIDNLEWDVKSYLILGGAMHDAAIATWSVKGYYDFIRPISAIRYMCSKGQSTDPTLQSFDEEGIPLIEDLTEIIQVGDPLAGTNNSNVGKIKIKAWQGPDFIDDPILDTAGVGWILGTHWWPYQRGTFVTPPFAGYVSGHSTFSAAAAEVLTAVTGDAFFPGGIGEFIARKDDFLFFEVGPSADVILQWATYRDAADQTSLSRIWGGIHPPMDDIPGRIMGEEIGLKVFIEANKYFNSSSGNVDCVNEPVMILHPIPLENGITLSSSYRGTVSLFIFDLNGREVHKEDFDIVDSNTTVQLPPLQKGVYVLKIINTGDEVIHAQKVIK